MTEARKIKQLVVITPNEVGTLVKVCRAINDAGGVISHMCASALGEDARFMLNVENAGKAKLALQRLEYEVREAEVLELELANRPGSLEPVAQQLGEHNVDIEFLYATSGDGKNVVCILSTNDNDRAVEIINRT